MLWQNLRMPGLLKKLDAAVYLSFSHYLPVTMPSAVMTIMGVANFAPFSELAKQAEVTSKGKLRLAMLKRTILSSANRARWVIALSGALRRELVTCGVDTRKIVVIPNGVEVPGRLDTAFDGGGEINQCGVSGEFLLYVSHFYRYKNFERLIKAYAGLSPGLRDRFALVLVGEPHDKEYYREVAALIEALRMRNRVVIIPGLPSRDLVSLYRAASVFVFPSLAENSPNILLEAMAHGAPAIVSHIEPMPEFGQDAVRYVDPLDIEAMTKEITALLADPEARESLGHRAWVQAGRFTWDDFTAKVVGLYNRG
jgi:glycosyltransferase involved in cell wall biosynthesis